MRTKINKTLVDSLRPGQTITDSGLDGLRVRAGKSGKFYSVQKRIGGGW